jgi:hypothetical protein
MPGTRIHHVASIALVIVAVLVSVPAAAAVTESEVVYPVVEVYDNACTGEAVKVTGARHMVTTFSETHIRVAVNWQKTTAVGVPSGDRYEANEVTRTYFFERKQPGVARMEEILELISLEPHTPNLILRATTTFNFVPPEPPETVTRLECSGQAEPLIP